MNYDVNLLNCGINEIEIARYTRLCYGKFGETGNEAKTLKNLIKKGHLTPFEMASMTFKIKAPIYVQRQIMRHRTGTFLEKSLRYTKNDPEFGTKVDDYTDLFGFGIVHSEEKNWQRRVKNLYGENLKTEKPEDARKVLTLDTLTEFIFHMDLRNLMHFFSLRLDKHAQKETRQVAKDMFIMFVLMFPITAKAYKAKEAKLIEDAFTQKELGEIWPVVETEPQIPTPEISARNNGRNGIHVPNDSFISETETSKEREDGSELRMAEQTDKDENNAWVLLAYGINN